MLPWLRVQLAATALLGAEIQVALAQIPEPDGFNPGAAGVVSAIALQPDGKVLAGGTLTSLGGTGRTRLGRVNADGTLDAGFNPGANATVYSLNLQPDGRILVGGDFTTLAGYVRKAIGRLNANGTIDSTFTTTAFNPPPGYSMTARAQAIVVQADGKILAAGRTQLTPPVGPTLPVTGYVLRLNTNGVSDTTFSAGAVNGPVTTLALQPDGKVLAGGLFTSVRSLTRNRLARLNTDGTLDSAFAPNCDGTVLCLALQADGRILVGGAFTSIGGEAHTNLARLNADGTVDSGFVAAAGSGATSAVDSLAVQADGKIVVAGAFNTLAGGARSNLGRLNPDGTLDGTFAATVNNEVYGVALQADGKLVLGGAFTTVSGKTRFSIARLYATEPAQETLTGDGSAISWQRGGTAPEVARATFEYSTDHLVWSFLGEGWRVPGGWEWTGIPFPPEAFVRARGYIQGAGHNGSGWFGEALSGPCYFVTQPVGRTNNAGTLVTLSAVAAGSQPMVFQWLKEGVPVEDGGKISGSTTSQLTLNNVFGPETGRYSLVASNSFGAVTSSFANLKVVDPYIQIQPVGSSNIFGTLAVFTATAVGSPPLSYRWRKDWADLLPLEGISGEQTPTLTITNVSGRDDGFYAVRVTNAFGTANSSWVKLTVVDPVIISQPISVTATPGHPAVFEVSALGSEPLAYLWRKNETPLPGQTTAQLSLPSVQCQDGGLYDVVVSNSYSAVTSSVAVLNIDANAVALDAWNPGSPPEVYSLAWLPGGKVLAGGGLFSFLGGQPCNYFGLLNPDGSLDTNFNRSVNNYVYSMLVQPDGRIVVGGLYTLMRVTASGSVDPGFTPTIGSASYWPRVLCLASQPDGKILAGGVFETLVGQTRYNLGRLNPNGTLDATFNMNVNWGWIDCCAVQTDGKILIGGPSLFKRLNPDGSVDGSFQGGAIGGTVYTLALQPDGKIIAAGGFTNLCGETCQHIGRAFADGTMDPSFTATANDTVASVALQADGRILVSGYFKNLSGQARSYLGRLQADGSLDCTFAPPVSGSDPTVRSLMTQPDGKALLGGEFSLALGDGRSSLARLVNTEPATDRLTAGAGTITWLRGGTAPEIVLASCEVSTNEVDWMPLGLGTRITGGWQWTAAALPIGAKVRARGVVQDSGLDSSSSWLVETSASVNPQPIIVTTDEFFGFKTNQFQFTTRFSAGETCVIEVSTNLSNWIPIKTNIVPPEGQFLFRDVEPTLPQRFYRVRR